MMPEVINDARQALYAMVAAAGRAAAMAELIADDFPDDAGDIAKGAAYAMDAAIADAHADCGEKSWADAAAHALSAAFVLSAASAMMRHAADIDHDDSPMAPMAQRCADELAAASMMAQSAAMACRGAWLTTIGAYDYQM